MPPSWRQGKELLEGAKRGGGWLSEQLSGIAPSQILKNPGGPAIPAYGLTGAFLKDVALDPIVHEATRDPETTLVGAYHRHRKDQLSQTIEQVRRKQQRQAILQSAARLAAINPQLYNQVMAGRRLPEGAMVFGGQPRVDLLEQLAFDMSQGSFEKPDPQADLSQLMGLQ